MTLLVPKYQSKTNLDKVSNFTGISKQLLFFDFNESILSPTINDNIIEDLTMNEMFKRLARLKSNHTLQREVL